MNKTWIQLTLSYLFITAIVGFLMRSAVLMPLPWFEYGNLLHAHSHLAILGWAYMALFLLILANFLGSETRTRMQFKILHAATHVTIIGMLISFALQGYAFFSISFSTLQVLLSYWLAVFVWRNLRRQADNSTETHVSSMFVKGSLVCLVVSSLGPWTLAVLGANHITGTVLNEVAIYFYLHFQYNGWLALGLAAVLLRILEKRNIRYPQKLAARIFWLYAVSLPPSYVLSVLWVKANAAWLITAAIGAVLQWVAVILLLVLILRLRSSFANLFTGWARIFLVLSFVVLFLKATMEIGTAVPGLATLVYNSRSVVIGYLHLTLLGFISSLCLALFLQHGWLGEKKKVERIGYGIFLIGFTVNELTLFLQGLFDWIDAGGLAYGSKSLWAASVLLATGIFMFSPKRLQRTHQK